MRIQSHRHTENSSNVIFRPSGHADDMITEIDQQIAQFQQNFALATEEIGKRIVGY